MKVHTILVSAAITSAAIFSSAVWAQPAPVRTAPGAENSGKADAGQLARADRVFLENAAQAGYAEIEGSRLAQDKATSPDVKSFAQTMIQDHTKVGDELKALATKKGYTPPGEPSIKQKAELKTISVLSGNAFDKTYASRIGVAAHESTVELFEKAGKDVRDPDIKAFAEKNLPALRHHLEMARALQSQLDKR